MRYFLFLFMVLSLNSCIKNNIGGSTDIYFDLNGLLKRQIDLLENRNYELSKLAILNNDTNRVEYNPDSLEWEDELNLLLSIDINKPIYQGLYTMNEKNADDSNLTILTFLHDKKENARVPYLEIHYLNDPYKPKWIIGEFRELSSVSESMRSIRITFEEIDHDFIISDYRIEGHQNLIGMDSVNFSIWGRVGVHSK